MTNIPVRCTLFHSNSILTKIIRKDDNRGIIKDSSKCFMSVALAGILEFQFRDFPSELRKISHNECICHGIYDHHKYKLENEEVLVEIITKHMKETKYSDDNSCISRTLNYFFYPKNNALLMFDYDIDANEDALSKEEYIDVMSNIIPGFGQCAKVISYSTSSYIYDSDGKLLSNERPSFHLYFVVKDSSDIQRFKTVLFKRCWLKGYGKIKVDNAKRCHKRTIFDDKVFSPERLDFVAGAKCEDGLIQKLPYPEYFDGGVLDTSLLPDLTPEEEIEYSKIINEKIKPYIEDYNKYKQKRIRNVQNKKNWTEPKARNYIEDRDDFVLWDEDILFLDKGKKITVNELLNDGKNYDQTTMSDPLAPEKGKNKAKFYWNDGKHPIIHSFAKHERIFRFKKYSFAGRQVVPTQTDVPPTFDDLDDFLSIDESRERLEEYLKSFFGKSSENQLVIMDCGIGKTRSFMKVFSQALQKTENLYDIRVAYFVPSNNLSIELLNEYCCQQNLVGMPTMIRGRGHHNKDMKHPCEWANQFYISYKNEHITEQEYEQKVNLITNKICKNCRLNQFCPYIKQFKKAESSHIIFLPHNYLFIINDNLKKLSQTITHIVIDEDIVDNHILNNSPGSGVYSCSKNDNLLASRIISDAEYGTDIKHILLKWKNHIHEEYNKVRKINNIEDAENISELNNNEYLNSVSEYNICNYKKTFWRNLSNICSEIENNRNKFYNNVWVDSNKLYICEKNSITFLWNRKKILYLDATADKDILQKALGMKFNVHRIKTKYHQDVQVIQTYGNQVSKKYLKKNLSHVFKSLNRHFNSDIPALITSKQIKKEALRKQLISQSLIKGHFKNIKGTDQFKDCNELIILGRYQINLFALEQKARMLFPVTLNSLNFEQKFQQFVFRMADGNNMSVMQNDYEIGSNIWKLNNHLSRSETLQAILRIRPFDVTPGNKKIIHIITSQVLDVTVNNLVPITEYIPNKLNDTGNNILNVLLDMLEDQKGIIFWKPKEISNSTGIPVKQLYSAKENNWFCDCKYWNLVSVKYTKYLDRGRKSNPTDKLIVSKEVEFNEEIFKQMKANLEIKNIKIFSHW